MPAGALPAFASASATPTEGAAAGTFPITYPASVTAGAKLFIIAWWRGGASCTINLHANAVSAGFTELQAIRGGGVARTSLLAVKTAVGDEDGTTIANAITVTGATSPGFCATMVQFTAADGFHATTPIIAMGVVDVGTATSLSGPSLTPNGANQLGVCFNVSSDNIAIPAFTGHTGGTGDWEEKLEINSSAGSDQTIQLQTIDLSGGAADAVSGGSASLTGSRIPHQHFFILVPADTTATATGTLAATEVADVAALVGTAPRTGTMAATSVADVAAFAGGIGTAGAMPAFANAGAAAAASSINGTRNVVRPVSTAAGNLMVMWVGTFDNLPVTVAMSSGMSSDGWQAFPGNPYVHSNGEGLCAFGFWKIATASDASGAGTNVPGGIVISGSDGSGDRFRAIIVRFTAANGFSATPLEAFAPAISVTGSSIGMPTVTPGSNNRLACCFIAGRTTGSYQSATGESGGDWTAAHDDGGNPGWQLQVSNQASGGISGGTTTATTTGDSLVLGFAIAPATLAGEITGTFAATGTADVPAMAGDVSGGVAGYVANPVFFDGTNDWLDRGGALTGLADGQIVLFSAWFRVTGGAGTERRIFTIKSGTSSRFTVLLTPSNALSVIGRSNSGVSILDVTGPLFTDTNWHHFILSCNLGDVGQRAFYIDGVSVTPTWNAYSGVNLDLDPVGTPEVLVGAFNQPGSLFRWNGDLAELYFITPGTWWNPSTGGDLFFSDGGPVDPAVAVAALGSPLVLLTGPTSAWHINQGTGGGFTENGALTDGAVALPPGTGAGGAEETGDLTAPATAATTIAGLAAARGALTGAGAGAAAPAAAAAAFGALTQGAAAGATFGSAAAARGAVAAAAQAAVTTPTVLTSQRGITSLTSQTAATATAGAVARGALTGAGQATASHAARAGSAGALTGAGTAANTTAARSAASGAVPAAAGADDVEAYIGGQFASTTAAASASGQQIGQYGGVGAETEAATTAITPAAMAGAVGVVPAAGIAGGNQDAEIGGEAEASIEENVAAAATHGASATTLAAFAAAVQHSHALSAVAAALGAVPGNAEAEAAFESALPGGAAAAAMAAAIATVPAPAVRMEARPEVLVTFSADAQHAGVGTARDEITVAAMAEDIEAILGAFPSEVSVAATAGAVISARTTWRGVILRGRGRVDVAMAAMFKH